MSPPTKASQNTEPRVTRASGRARATLPPAGVPTLPNPPDDDIDVFTTVTGSTNTRLAQAPTAPPPDVNRFTPLADDDDEGTTSSAASAPLLTPADDNDNNDDPAPTAEVNDIGMDPALARTRALLQAHDRTLSTALAAVTTLADTDLTTEGVEVVTIPPLDTVDVTTTGVAGTRDVLASVLDAIHALKHVVTTIDTRIGLIDDKFGALAGDITTLNNKLDADRVRYDDLISSVESRQTTRIAQLETDLGDLSNKLTTTSDNVGSLLTASTAATTDREDIRRTLASEITTLQAALTRDVNSKFGHITKTEIPKAMERAVDTAVDKATANLEPRLLALESRSTPPAHDNAPVSPGYHTGAVNAPEPAGTHRPPPLQTVEEDTTAGYYTEDDHARAVRDDNIADDTLADIPDGVYTADDTTGYVGPYVGPLEASRLAYASARRRAGNGATVPRATPQRPTASTTTPPMGGPISSPRNMDRERHAREHSVSRFDVTALAHPAYHGHRDGYASINAQYLQSCGYDSFTADDVVTCFNDIISAHDMIFRLWTNSTYNTTGPQVARILQKSLKLFPTLASTSTDDVVEFYDRLQEVASSHLIGIMPFDAVRLRHRFEGLCIPGLGLARYAAMAKALMELLPHLIPGRLSPQINAALYAVRYETANGYDYLWRVLELTVPGFDPVIPIQIPAWGDIGDIFGFSQAYLLYFRLQGKMNFHYDDRTRSGIFLRAIQNTDLADTVTTLQSQVNSFRDTDEGYLPPHLRLHGLATSIHQNIQARLRDIVSPRARRVNASHSLIQGPPRINRVGRDGVGRDNRQPHTRFRNESTPPHDHRDRALRTRDHGHDRPPRPQGRLARPDRNRRPFLPDVQCDACKKVGHVAKHCDMLATAICLERYMKHDLSAPVRDSIERDWLDRWKSRLGNPDRTPRQVMRAYVEDLDITVATLDEAMEWDCWDNTDEGDDNDSPGDASV